MRTNPGIGWEPMTLSTASFIGSGVSSASGAVARFNSSVPAM